MSKNWEDLKPIDHELICRIVDRARNEGFIRTLFDDRERIDLMMDLSAAHLSHALRLQDWLKADKFNFLHDVAGIRHHMNRDTGELENGFLPRFATK